MIEATLFIPRRRQVAQCPFSYAELDGEMTLIIEAADVNHDPARALDGVEMSLTGHLHAGWWTLTADDDLKHPRYARRQVWRYLEYAREPAHLEPVF